MNAPPGPSGGPLGLRNGKRLQDDLFGFIVDLAREHGDAVSYRIGPVRVFQFAHPDANHEILVTKNHAFHKPEKMRQVLSQWNGNGLVVNEGEPWVRQRRLVNPAFKPQRVAGYLDVVLRRCDVMLDGWARAREVDASGDLQRLTLGVVAEALFGAEVDRHTARVLEAVAVLNAAGLRELSSIVVLPLWAPTPAKRRLREAIAVLDELARGFIAARRETNEDRGDLLSLMLLTDDEGGTGRLDDEQARDESVNLLLGGNETTATALTWALHLLSRHPAVLAAMRAEIARVTGGAPLAAEHLPRMTLVENVFKEAMRLYPPAYMLPRQAIEDTTIAGFDVPRGTHVHVALYVTHHDARWYPDPEAFRPERFADEASLPRGAYLAFGAGPRACIGRGFGMMEGVAALASIARRVSLRPVRDEVELEAQVSLHPKGGLRLGVDVEPR